MANNTPVQKTVGTPSVSGPSQPSKPSFKEFIEANPELHPKHNKAQIPHKTMSDGDTDVSVSVLGRGNPQLGEMPMTEKEHYAPCLNPSCKSMGKPHPNCLCYAGPGGTSLENSFFAHGGCVGAHKEDCEHYADGGITEENQQMLNDPQSILDHTAVSHGLLGLLTKVGFSKSEDKHKHFEDYKMHHKKGHKIIHGHLEKLFDHSQRIEKDDNARNLLKSHLDDLHKNPEKMLEIGGNISENLPSHGAHLGAMAGVVTQYLNALKPQMIPHPNQAPLDAPTPANKAAEAHYNRHVDIAQNPSLIVQHVKDGTLRPDDLMTLNTLYPRLAKNITSKAYEQLISAKANNVEIPYKQRLSLSLLLGMPIDSTMTPQSMQAIMAVNGAQEIKNQGTAPKKPKKASNVELKQINRTDEITATDLQDREIDKKKH